ncbi:unnamed protein product [Cylicocyclus nassatus]|uniref:Receptor L-domain domain-containing protein n=1 Tax=Cylicocyclus nassatus TaxID=53992 RepID=A0AA36GRE5_CYLNA|nr:unnamed protein product [Cylicocyclus nassatus]
MYRMQLYVQIILSSFLFCTDARDCSGGIVTVGFLQTHIKGRRCKKINGGLYFLESDWTYKSELLDEFENVVNVSGPLHFAATKGMGHVKCFRNVEEIHSNGPAIVLLRNVGLLSLDLTALQKIDYDRRTKAVILHSNEGLYIDQLFDSLESKGITASEILSTSRIEFMNTIWSVIFFSILFLLVACILGIVVYKTTEEIHEILKLLRWQKRGQQYVPPEPPRTSNYSLKTSKSH